VQHHATINALHDGKVQSPQSPANARTRSNSNLDNRDAVVEAVSAHPLHEDGMRPRSGSNRESVNSHAAVAASSLYVPPREPVFVEQNAKYHSSTMISSLGSNISSSLGMALSASGDKYHPQPDHPHSPSQEHRSILSLDSSKHALLASTHEKDGGGDGAMAMDVGRMMVDADYDYESDSSDGGGAIDEDRDDADEDGGRMAEADDVEMTQFDNSAHDIEQAGAIGGKGSYKVHSRVPVRDRPFKELASQYSALPSSSARTAAAAADMTPVVQYAAWACMALAILSGAAIGPGMCGACLLWHGTTYSRVVVQLFVVGID
jgi:hypothetical protein